MPDPTAPLLLLELVLKPRSSVGADTTGSPVGGTPVAEDEDVAEAGDVGDRAVDDDSLPAAAAAAVVASTVATSVTLGALSPLSALALDAGDDGERPPPAGGDADRAGIAPAPASVPVTSAEDVGARKEGDILALVSDAAKETRAPTGIPDTSATEV